MIEDENSIRSSMERFILLSQDLQIEQDKAYQRKIKDSDNTQTNRQIQKERIIERLNTDISSVQRSSRTANEIKEMTFGIFETLREQNFTLKNARKKLLEISNTIGLTKSLLRIIERRQTVDQIIVYSSMVIILLLMIFLVYLVKF